VGHLNTNSQAHSVQLLEILDRLRDSGVLKEEFLTLN